MTQRLVHRPARAVRPLALPPDKVVSTPPSVGGSTQQGLPIQALLPLVGALSSMTMMLVLRNNPVMVLVGLVVLVVALVGGVGMALSQRGNAARTRREQRERYLDYLEELRAELGEVERTTRDAAHVVHPSPAGLLDVARDPARRWERRRWDADFLEVRIGLGDRPVTNLVLPSDDRPTEPPDAMLLAEARGVVERFSRLRSVPVTVPLDRVGEVAVVGSREDVVGVTRSLLAQVATLHAPDDVAVALVFPPSRAADWAGVDSLPHVVDDEAYDGPAPVRRVAPSVTELMRVVGPELHARSASAAESRRRSGGDPSATAPRMIVVVDGYGDVASPVPSPDSMLSLADLGVTVVHLVADRLQEPSDVALRVTAVEGSVLVEDLRPSRDEPVPARAVSDAVAPAILRGLAYTLAPLRLTASEYEESQQGRVARTDELLGVDDVTRIDVAAGWQPRSARDFLRVPIGLDDDGNPLMLDLKESAQLGMGPHGLCVGATGSGKSELLRTLVAALALSHPPEDLAMILVDYKGGAAFAPFEDLPHVAGLMDNLADDAGLTERARSSISGEILRRQQVLRAAGSPSISHYREMRREDRSLEALPHLLLVIDEFGELLTAEPDFVDLLLMIGRIGRSIGVHLLLSSQRIEGGKLRGLDTYLSYRVGLRTFSEAESRVVLDTPDAFHLPAVPGFGFLKVDTSVYRRFRAAYVSGPVEKASEQPEPEDDLRRPLRLGTYNGVRAANDIVSRSASAGRSEPTISRPSVSPPMVDVIVRQLRSAAPSARPVWLDPLPSRLTLGRVLGRTEPPTSEELSTVAQEGRTLSVPVGLLDDPSRQRQDPWLLDLARAGGHVALIGAPQAGRTTFLWTLTAGLAMTHTPQQVSVYGMDLTGGGLARIEGFPHVGGVATRASRDRLRRLLEELHGMLAERERVFARRGIDSLAMLRSRSAAGLVPELAAAVVVLLVDGVGRLRQDFEELEDRFGDLLQRGGGFGIHVVAAMGRWNELRPALQNLIGTRVELRLNDAADSTVGRKLAATIKPAQVGRALTDESLFGQVALPVLDPAYEVAPDEGDTADDSDEARASAGDAVGAALDELADRSAGLWHGPVAAPIRLLPEHLTLDALPDPLDEPEKLPFGLRQDSMSPALLDLAGRDQHLLVLGDTQSGKSTLLRTLVTDLVERSDPDDLVVALYDVRSSIVDTCPEEYLGGHASNPTLAQGLSASIASELEKRSVALGAAARGGGVEGPRIVVVVDDYDILASGGTDPLRPLLPYLPAARDLRLHLLVARPVAGASRALYEPVLQAVRDTGGSGFLMSGDRAEGQLFPGLRAEALPPGRGRWVRRGERSVLVQVAVDEPAVDLAAGPPVSP